MAAPTASDPLATWRGWWLVNDRAFLPERADESLVSTPSPTAEAVVEGRRRRREMAVSREVLPAVRALIDPKVTENDLIRRAGLLALGKLGETPGDATLLVTWLTNPKVDLRVREAAALGAGLLRRTEPSRQLEPTTLDALRAQLAGVSDDASAPIEVRATCALALGLLGDQPFSGGIHREGRLMTRRLWRSLEAKGSRTDLVVALLTALGMQPAAGVPEAVREGLQDIVVGRPALGHPWTDLERGHALTSLVRIEGGGALTIARHMLAPRRVPDEVRRAGLIALGRLAPDLPLEDRLQTAALVREALGRASDPLTKGLGSITIGRFVSAQAVAGDPIVRDLESLWRQLLRDAQHGSLDERGFAVLGLGLAARPAGDDAACPRSLRAVRGEVESLLLAGIESERLDPDLRGAHAIALGLMQARSAVPALVRVVEERDAITALRHDAAVALGQIGHDGPEVVRALQLGLSERKRPRVQAGSALALSLLRGTSAASSLLRELEHASTGTEVLRLVEPLGYLGDPALARPLVEYVRTRSNADRTRAFLLVALGNLGDREPRPSLAVLGRDANYPGAPPVLLDTLRTR